MKRFINKKFRYTLNLQFFADGEGGGDGAAIGDAGQNNSGDGGSGQGSGDVQDRKGEKTFTQDGLNRILSAPPGQGVPEVGAGLRDEAQRFISHYVQIKRPSIGTYFTFTALYIPLRSDKTASIISFAANSSFFISHYVQIKRFFQSNCRLSIFTLYPTTFR